MTIQDALNKAVADGYHVQGADGVVTVYSGANSDFTLWTRTDNASSFIEFIPIKPLVARVRGAPGSCAGHSRVPSRDHGRPPSTAGSGLSQCDSASRYC
jgi:hypothetical protein